MPFLGKIRNELVYPHEVSKDADIYCPKCDTVISIVDSHMRQNTHIRQHFRHPPKRPCDGVDDIHDLMAVVLKERMEDKFGNIGEFYYEKKLDDKRADVFLDLHDDIDGIGSGIVFEVQYKNDSKDILSTTLRYAQMGYTTVWAFQDAFSIIEHNDYYICKYVKVSKIKQQSVRPKHVIELDDMIDEEIIGEDWGANKWVKKGVNEFGNTVPYTIQQIKDIAERGEWGK